MYRLLKFTGILLKNIPRKAGYFFFSLIAWFAFLTGGPRKETLKQNLSRITGKNPDSKTLWQNYRNYAMYYFDLLKTKETCGSFDMKSFEPLAASVKQNLDKGAPMIVTTMHYGNWDLGGAILSYFSQVKSRLWKSCQAAPTMVHGNKKLGHERHKIHGC